MGKYKTLKDFIQTSGNSTSSFNFVNPNDLKNLAIDRVLDYSTEIEGLLIKIPPEKLIRIISKKHEGKLNAIQFAAWGAMTELIELFNITEEDIKKVENETECYNTKGRVKIRSIIKEDIKEAEKNES